MFFIYDNGFYMQMGSHRRYMWFSNETINDFFNGTLSIKQDQGVINKETHWS